MQIYHFSVLKVAVCKIKLEKQKAICGRLLNTYTSKERTPQMTYHHLTIDELTMIANFRDQGVKAYRAAKLLYRSLETVYRVYRFLAAGHTLQEYCQHIVKTRLIAVGRPDRKSVV